MNTKTIKDLCLEYGYSQTALAKRFDIPLRTVQNWHGGQREPAPYLVPMMEEILRGEKAEAARKESWQKMKQQMEAHEAWRKNHPHRGKTARWRRVVVNGLGYHKECSACGTHWMLDSSEHVCKETPFCPGCGAKMKEEGEGCHT